MGLFTDSELSALNDLFRSAGAHSGTTDRDEERIENVYFDNPDRLHQRQRESIGRAIEGYADAKGTGIDNEFEDEIPELFHKGTRTKQERSTDRAFNANRADTWEEYIRNANRLDWPGVDTRR